MPSSPAETYGMRQYYLSKAFVPANQAKNACAAGYHFASIWEIADPSSLRYNTSLGRTSSDSGAGPPTAIPFLSGVLPLWGWVRTGYSSTSSETPGHGNCYNWETGNQIFRGTAASLPNNWTAGEQDIGLFRVEARTCDTQLPAWCVQDDILFHIYLPLVDK